MMISILVILVMATIDGGDVAHDGGAVIVDTVAAIIAIVDTVAAIITVGAVVVSDDTQEVFADAVAKPFPSVRLSHHVM